MQIKRLGVVGAGTMGSGIAALAASAGIPVVLLDIPAPKGDRNDVAKGGLEHDRGRVGPAPNEGDERPALAEILHQRSAGRLDFAPTRGLQEPQIRRRNSGWHRSPV